jgi:tetratricopeptide (TPR) repeat protein
MGLLNFLKQKTIYFQPDFRKEEHDNWLDFIAAGGTDLEWERLKAANGWRFREGSVERLVRYEKEVKPFADRYFKQMQEIENEWSALYNLGTYTGSLADSFERKCLSNIANYKEMRRIDSKHGRETATNIPAFRRLAMLYEKQGRFEDAVEVCKQAWSLGMDERSRMVRMIKKAGRTATEAELKLLE